MAAPLFRDAIIDEYFNVTKLRFLVPFFKHIYFNHYLVRTLVSLAHTEW